MSKPKLKKAKRRAVSKGKLVPLKVVKGMTLRERTLAKYGLTLKDYDDRFKEQQGKCSICKEAERVSKSGRVISLSVDHNHGTGQVRGLLCMKCNRLLLGRLEKCFKNPTLVAKGLYEYSLKYPLNDRA